MKREPRGFQYTLEPLRSKCAWDLQQRQLDLARLHARVEDQAGKVRQREDVLAAATAEVARQQGKAQVIFADKQQMAHTYLSQQARQLQHARKMLKELEAARDLVVAELHRLRKYADELDDNRNEEIKDYTKVAAKAEITEADDAWLRGMTWRTTQ